MAIAEEQQALKKLDTTGAVHAINAFKMRGDVYACSRVSARGRVSGRVSDRVRAGVNLISQSALITLSQRPNQIASQRIGQSQIGMVKSQRSLA